MRFVRPRLRGLWLLPVLTMMASPSSGEPAGRAHWVLAHFDNSGGGDSRLQIVDPRTGEQSRFGGVRDRQVQWDPSFREAEFLADGQIFRLRWEREALPWRTAFLPGTLPVADWWFDPDSSCWQVAASVPLRREPYDRNRPPLVGCRSELWQSDRHGRDWHRVRSDSAGCGSCYFCESWQLVDERSVRRPPRVTWRDLEQAMSIDGWGGPMETIPSPDDRPDADPWTFVPSRSVPGVGLAMQVIQRPRAAPLVRLPMYWLDRAHGRRQVVDLSMSGNGVPPPPGLPGGGRDIPAPKMAERDGMLLIGIHRAFVLDLRTGMPLLSEPRLWGGAVWIPAPAAPSVDEAGLTRLRARFR